jgi:hypothetical protein
MRLCVTTPLACYRRRTNGQRGDFRGASDVTVVSGNCTWHVARSFVVLRADDRLLRSSLTSMCPTKADVSQKTRLSSFAANSQDNKNHLSRLQLQRSSLALVRLAPIHFLGSLLELPDACRAVFLT